MVRVLEVELEKYEVKILDREKADRNQYRSKPFELKDPWIAYELGENEEIWYAHDETYDVFAYTEAEQQEAETFPRYSEVCEFHLNYWSEKTEESTDLGIFHGNWVNLFRMIRSQYDIWQHKYE